MKVMDALNKNDKLTLTLLATDGTRFSTTSLNSAKNYKSKSVMTWNLEEEIPPKVFNIAVIHSDKQVLKSFWIKESFIDRTYKRIKLSFSE